MADEGKRGDAPTEVRSAVESSATNEEFKKRDLKLDRHKRSESSETLSTKGLCETVQNRSESVKKKSVTKSEPLSSIQSQDGSRYLCVENIIRNDTS